MVATNVIEEGLDVPACNTVIKFDPCKNFQSYVQAMGRARQKDALFIMLGEEDEKYRLVSDLKLYKELNKEIIKVSFHCISRKF